MKKLVVFLVLGMVSVYVYSADLVVTVTIPEAKVVDFLENFCTLYPNGEVDEDGNFTYTDAEWWKECIRRQTVSQDYRGAKKKARAEAYGNVTKDDELLNVTGLDGKVFAGGME